MQRPPCSRCSPTQPDEDPYAERQGLLYWPTDEVTIDQLADAGLAGGFRGLIGCRKGSMAETEAGPQTRDLSEASEQASASPIEEACVVTQVEVLNSLPMRCMISVMHSGYARIQGGMCTPYDSELFFFRDISNLRNCSDPRLVREDS